MDINDMPFEEALDIYYELVHAVKNDDEECIIELKRLYPSLFTEENLQYLAETAERVQDNSERLTLSPLPETNTRKARINIQLDRINRLVRENARFFGDNLTNDALYIELAVDKLEEIVNRQRQVQLALQDPSGKIVALKSTLKK